LADTRRTIEAWHQDYNTVSPHSAWEYITPKKFEQDATPTPLRIPRPMARSLCASGQALGSARRQTSCHPTRFKNLNEGPAVWAGQDGGGYEAAVRRREVVGESRKDA